MQQQDNDRIRIIFFGTQEFAATILEGLIHSSLFSVTNIMTQPRKPVGRKKEIQKSPVQMVAERYDIAVDQPPTLKNYPLPITHYQLAIVAQYGLLIPKNILESFPLGVLNVHPSLLPTYRGATPIQTALMHGDTETGITIMKLDEGMDTGPILLQKKISISPDETYPELEKRLAHSGLDALLETIPPYSKGTLIPTPQENSRATYCRELTRDDGRIDWQKTNKEIYNQYRALQKWPGIWTMWDAKRLKLLRVQPIEKTGVPGIVSIHKKNILVGCKENSLEIMELQIEGKKSMDAKAFIHGHHTFSHARFS